MGASASIPSAETVGRIRYLAQFVIRAGAVAIVLFGLAVAAGPAIGTAMYLIDGDPLRNSPFRDFETFEILDIPLWTMRAAAVIESSSLLAAVQLLFGRAIIAWTFAAVLLMFGGRIVRFVAPTPVLGCPICGYACDLRRVGSCPECGVAFGGGEGDRAEAEQSASAEGSA